MSEIGDRSHNQMSHVTISYTSQESNFFSFKFIQISEYKFSIYIKVVKATLLNVLLNNISNSNDHSTLFIFYQGI